MPLSASPTKWSNTLKQFVGNFPTNCLSVFDYFVGLKLKGLTGLHTILFVPESYYTASTAELALFVYQQ